MITFEEWYAANRETISEFSRNKYLPSQEKKQKAVAEIVWNLTRPGVTYTIDKTTEIKKIDLTGGGVAKGRPFCYNGGAGRNHQ